MTQNLLRAFTIIQNSQDAITQIVTQIYITKEIIGTNIPGTRRN